MSESDYDCSWCSDSRADPDDSGRSCMMCQTGEDDRRTVFKWSAREIVGIGITNPEMVDKAEGQTFLMPKNDKPKKTPG